MLKNVWGKVKKNYAVLIAIATTIVTVLYAVIKFVIYTYWSGYFNRLNIDNNYMKINYEGIIYQALLIFIMFLAVIYVMVTLETLYEDKWTKYKAKVDKKFLRFLSMTAMNKFITSVLLVITNYPWVIFICAWGNFELNLETMFAIITLLSILEVGFILYHLIFDKKTTIKKQA